MLDLAKILYRSIVSYVLLWHVIRFTFVFLSIFLSFALPFFFLFVFVYINVMCFTAGEMSVVFVRFGFVLLCKISL